MTDVPTEPRMITGQRARILALVCSGCSNREIAEELSISETTVKTHCRRMFRQLGVDREGAVRAVRDGRVFLEGD